MRVTAFLALVRKDLKIFFGDRRAVIMGFAAPIAIASFVGVVFPGQRGPAEPMRVTIHVVDQDGGAVAKALVAGIRADRNLAATVSGLDEARTAVTRGKTTVAVVIPARFGDAAAGALVAGRERPRLELLYDPAHTIELSMVRGMLTEHVMQAVTEGMLPAPGVSPPQLPRPRFRLPYGVREQALTGRTNVVYNGYAHAFGGMSVQFLMFAAVDLAIGMLLERQRGLWKRLRSAPISRLTLLGGKAASGAVIALMTLGASFGFAIVVFGVRIHGSVIGFAGIAIACALMASTFGLLVAALGHTPAGTRGIAIFAVLIMVMLGGAWFPTFFFPAWLQRITVVVPTRWAVDGFDAMTWRGLDLASAAAPIVTLLAFAAAFGAIAVARFRWDEA